MEIASLKTTLKTGSPGLKSFYIFTGTEWKVQQIYIDQIVKVSGKQKKYIDSITDILSKMKNRSFIKQSFVYVLRDDKTLMTDEQLQSRLSSLLRDDILILLVTNMDKRTKFYKKYGSNICEFEQLKPQILKKYIQKEVNLSDSNCEKLMEVCEYDYGRCLLEIDKLKRYRLGMDYTDDDKVYNHVLKELLDNGTIYQPPYDAIFDFVDAVLRRKVNTSFNLLYQCYGVGEATMVMLTVLYNNAKQVYQVQTCQSNDVVKSTGMTAWQVKCARERTGHYSNEELKALLRLIHKCECGIKSGKIEEAVVMEYILIHTL